MKRWMLTALAVMTMTGCGATATPLSAVQASGAMAAAAAKKKETAKNPFTGLSVTVEPLAVLCPCVSISATNGAKLKIAINTEDDALDGVTVNRSTLVKNGKLVLTKGEPSGMLLSDEESTEATGGSAEARRRTSFLGILEKLADGLKAAKTDKKDAKAVKDVVEALKAFVKAERAKDAEPGDLLDE